MDNSRFASVWSAWTGVIAGHAITRLALLFIAVTTLFAAGSRDLLIAIRDGDHARAQKLLRAGVDVNSRDADGTTALMHSVIESDVNMIKLLLASGAQINAKNAAGSTALMYAAVNLEKTQLLLNRGPDVKVKGNGGATPMSVAVTRFGSTPVLKLLMAKGAEPETGSDSCIGRLIQLFWL